MEDWQHTIDICVVISKAKKPIVIITKHWDALSDKQLKELSQLDVCVNTSVSALDTGIEIVHRLEQYNKLKKYCNSVLRIVSCDFVQDNPDNFIPIKIQENLFKNDNIINTVFRPSINNPLVINGVINVKKVKFLKSQVWASVYKETAYLGLCKDCPDMCGISKKGGI